MMNTPEEIQGEIGSLEEEEKVESRLHIRQRDMDDAMPGGVGHKNNYNNFL